MRYYSTQNPVTVDDLPKQKNNEVLEIHNYEKRQFVSEIEKDAYGWAEYEKPISSYDAHAYGLVPVPTRTLHLKYIGRDSWDRHVYEDENKTIWKHVDCSVPKEVCQEMGHMLYSSCGNTMDGEPDYPMDADIKIIFNNDDF